MPRNWLIKPSEENETVALHRWLTARGIPHTHVANESYGGTHRDLIRGAKFKAMGRSKGFPDMLVFATDKLGRHLNIAIELKKIKTGRVSPEQKEWLQTLDKHGWYTKVCYGSDEAIAFINAISGY